MSAGFEGAVLPSFVRREFDSYLGCGLLCRGFARLKCEKCAEQYLVAFACKGRGFCPSCMGRRMCQMAAVVAVQRASSDLKLNPHLHVVFLDGGILGYLERGGVIVVDRDADVLRVDDDLAERDPALAQLAAAAVSGLAPAGPELRRRPVELVFEGRPGIVIAAPLSVREAGFSLHAATRAGAEDEKGREALSFRHRGSTWFATRGAGPGRKVEAAHRAEAAAARRRRLGSGARLVRSAGALRHHRLALSP
ncbi:MAG TPA: transposase zinc-binding domain-containing protein, partial [Polyangiaceae bacterium]|nr:transposase zinc-binding domain-containing protein [Polyangiaceae bacterium]